MEGSSARQGLAVYSSASTYKMLGLQVGIIRPSLVKIFLRWQ
jgi:hypothetical protein